MEKNSTVWVCVYVCLWGAEFQYFSKTLPLLFMRVRETLPYHKEIVIYK